MPRPQPVPCPLPSQGTGPISGLARLAPARLGPRTTWLGLQCHAPYPPNFWPRTTWPRTTGPCTTGPRTTCSRKAWASHNLARADCHAPISHSPPPPPPRAYQSSLLASQAFAHSLKDCRDKPHPCRTATPPSGLPHPLQDCHTPFRTATPPAGLPHTLQDCHTPCRTATPPAGLPHPLQDCHTPLQDCHTPCRTAPSPARLPHTHKDRHTPFKDRHTPLRGEATTILKKCNFCILHPISFILIPNESPLQELSNGMLYSVHRPPIYGWSWSELITGYHTLT